MFSRVFSSSCGSCSASSTAASGSYFWPDTVRPASMAESLVSLFSAYISSTSVLYPFNTDKMVL